MMFVLLTDPRSLESHRLDVLLTFWVFIGKEGPSIT
jgi:hypothetical protein